MKLGPHTITVVSAATKPADYGTGTELDWTNVTRTQVSDCSVQPAPTEEFTVDRDTFIARWQVFAPASTQVSADDRIEWDGNTYDVDGDVLRWGFGALSHIVLNLRRSQEA